MKVAVIGAGSIGSHTALQLVESGHEVTVFERFPAPNLWGAHAGESRLVRSVPYLETAPGDRDILRDSVTAWKALEERIGRPILNLCGGLIIGAPDADAFVAAAGEAAVLRYRGTHASRTFPQFALQDHEEVLLDPFGGLVDPQHAVSATLELATRAGVRIVPHARVTGVSGSETGAELRIGDGAPQQFDRIVVATGAFSRELLPELPIVARRLLLGWFEPLPEQRARLAGMPSFVWTPGRGEFLYGGPSSDGHSVKIGVDAAWGEVDDAVTGRTVSADDIAPLRESVRTYLPWLDADSGRYEMHTDAWSADGHGLLGEVVGVPNVVVSSGWTGHGFKIAPIIGEITAAVTTGRGHGYDISHLDPARFAPR